MPLFIEVQVGAAAVLATTIQELRSVDVSSEIPQSLLDTLIDVAGITDYAVGRDFEEQVRRKFAEMNG